MRTGSLPARAERTVQLVAEGREPPEDPVGLAVARFLTELLDGLVVELTYTDTETAGPTPPDSAIAHRQGPGRWATTLHVQVAGGAAALCVDESADPQLPAVLADFSAAAFRAADEVGRASGLDGNMITPPMQQALIESVVAEIVSGLLERLSGGVRSAAAFRGLVSKILGELERTVSTTVEREALSLGLVLRPTKADHPTAHRFPDDYRQRRVPLLFDGDSAVLIIDADGRTERESAAPSNHPNGPSATSVRAKARRHEGLGGSAVVAVSHALGAVGFYARHDRSIWVCVNGQPVLVKRAGRWRALPSNALVAGMSRLVGNVSTAGLIVETALLLSMNGHGAILAVTESGDELDASELVPAKDRVDRILPGTSEAPIHDVLNIEGLDAATLSRFASIDGACILDRDGKLLAYGAVVSSHASEGEGARTAAARYLSEHLDIVVKVSEDGPITVFSQGQELGRLLD